MVNPACAAVRVALLAPDGNAGEVVVTGGPGGDAERDHYAFPFRAMWPVARAVHAIHEVMGYFMRHGVSQVVVEIGRKHPRVVADHALPGYHVPAELAGGQPAQVEPDLD